MSIEAMVHQQWSRYRPLAELVPPPRLFTGLASGDAVFPYVTLQRLGQSAVRATSSGNRLAVDALAVRIWDSDLDRAKRIAARIDDCFERPDFAWSDGRVLDMRRTNLTEEETSPGRWRVTLTYTLRTCATVRANAI